MTVDTHTQFERALRECAADIDALYARCAEAAPNYGVAREEFAAAVCAGASKYLLRGAEAGGAVSGEDVRQFVAELQAGDLFLALACARGNEHSWWDFDAGYRRYIERVAQHLASSAPEAEEVLDSVYTELYGTRVVEGVRQSKFATYTGRGSLRGWLRVIVWHAVVDLHRARRDEVTIDEWSEGGGEMDDRPGWRAEAHGGEAAMIDHVARTRYAAAVAGGLDEAFAALENHEKLLLFYYHVEGLKLREIARLVEEPRSPLRRWFQRQTKPRAGSAAQSRVHESTVMRWLEKVYARINRRFTDELREKAGLSAEEVSLCLEMAAGGLNAPETFYRHLTKAAEGLGKDEAE